MPLLPMTKAEEELTRAVADLLGISYEEHVKAMEEMNDKPYESKPLSEGEKRWLEGRYGRPVLTDEDLERMHKRIMDYK